MLQKKPGLRILMAVLLAVFLTAGLQRPVATNGATTRVIVRGNSVALASRAVLSCGGTVESEIGIIDAVVAVVPETQVAALADCPGVTLVTPDRAVEVSATELERTREPYGQDLVSFTESIGVDAVWESGTLGQGVTVAVLDTGINPTFSELRRTQGYRGWNRLVAYYDAIEDRVYRHPYTLRSPRDPNGHGTHVAGIIANGYKDGSPDEYRGVAPAADLVAVRVLNEEGAGSYGDVLKGIDWVVSHKDRYNIRVLNISMYSIPVAPYWADPYNLAVMAAWDAGIVVVASAGNTGSAPMSVGVPGNTPYVITAGAFTDHRTPEDFGDDYIPEFSASGPTLDAFVKPDVVAPGAHVVSLMRPNAYLRDLYPERRVNGRYFEMSGTSMSTAVVSGIAALVISENPDLTPDEVKYRLTATARPQLDESGSEAAYSIWQQGAGRVWAADAVLGDLEGAANQGMDIAADLVDDRGYQGWTTFDEATGTFQVIGGGFDSWLSGYTTWDGSYFDYVDGYGTWAGGATNWADSFSSWADSFSSWADGYNSWAGSFSSWADSFSSWADGFDSWADVCLADPSEAEGWQSGFSTQGDSFSSWADSFSSWADYSVWVDSFDGWSDDLGIWTDSFSSWADGATGCNEWVDSFSSWADGFVGWSGAVTDIADGSVAWSGAYSSWEGGYLTWANSFSSWADSFSSWADGYDAWANLCGVEPESFSSWADGFSQFADGTDAQVDSFSSWADSFSSWADSFSSWADYTVWTDSFSSWADSFSSWADGFELWSEDYVGDTRPVACGEWTSSFSSWADSFSSWADSFSSWADGNPNLAGSYGDWDGGYTSWVGGYEMWVGSFSSWADNVGDPDWAVGYADLAYIPSSVSPVMINLWVELEE